MKDKKEQERLIDHELEDCFKAANCASATDCTGTVTRGSQFSGSGSGSVSGSWSKVLTPKCN